MNFHLLDWIILFAYLAISVFVGIRAKRYVENMEGYFVAGRRVKVALGSATLIATEIGVVTFMYFGELGYVTGLSCFFLGVIGFFGYYVIGKTGFIVPLDDYEMLAERIVRCLTDRELSERLVQQGKEYLRQFTAERMIEGLEEIYEAVMKTVKSEW